MDTPAAVYTKQLCETRGVFWLDKMPA